MKRILLPDAVPTIFNADSPKKKQKTDYLENAATVTKNTASISSADSKKRLLKKVFTEKGLVQLVLFFL